MRAVQLDFFGGPELLAVREIPAPQAGPGQIRVRVTAAGLNPMDWIITADADTAARFGLSLPVGFGTDYAGVIDQVGDGVSGFAVGDRVFGGALSRAVADFVLINVTGGIAAEEAHHIPDGIDDSRRYRRPHRRNPGDRRSYRVGGPGRGEPGPG